MRKLFVSRSATLVLFFFTATVNLHAQTGQPPSLVDTIVMPNVKGRLDHLYVDVGSKRLFVAALEMSAHTFRFITPAETEQSEIPDPCTSCHTEKCTSGFDEGRTQPWKEGWIATDINVGPAGIED